MLPSFQQFNMSWLAKIPIIAMVIGWLTLIVETLYPIYVWLPKLRVIGIVSVICLHFFIGLFLGMWLFAIIMIILTCTAFGYEALNSLREYQVIKNFKLLRWKKNIFYKRISLSN